MDSHTLIFSFDASEINNWSDTAEARHKLPELIRRLMQQTLSEPPFPIRVPSGSSVGLPGWDGLLKVEIGNQWVPSGVSCWEFSCDKSVTKKVNIDYGKRTKEPLDYEKSTAAFVFVTSRRWTGKEKWESQRRKEGEWRDVRALDADDLVAWLQQSDEVTRWLYGEIHRRFFEFERARKGQELQEEISNKLTAGFAALGVAPEVMSAPIATQAKQPESELEEDLEQREYSERLDFVRDLIQQGLIATARTQLEELESEAEQLSDTLRFRLLTNLAACALGEDRYDEAINLLTEAHVVQPENRTGITNAALAAELQQDFRRAADLAKRALDQDPRDPNAAAAFISALWGEGESEELEDFVSSEDWISQESASALALARVRVRQERYDEATAVYRTLIEVEPDEPLAHLGLSQCLLARDRLVRLPVAYAKEELSSLREAEIAAERAIELLRVTQIRVRFHDALLLRAGARALLGKYDAAIDDVNLVLAEVPEHPAAVQRKGLLLLKKGLAVEAREWLERIQDPEARADSLLPLADACLESGDPTTAAELLKDSFKLDPPEWEDIGRAQSLLRAEAEIGTVDSVGPLLEDALAQFPENPFLYTLAAVRSNLKGDSEATAEAFNRAIELSGEPLRRALQIQLGHHYANERRFAEAADQVSKAIGDDAAHPEAVQMLLFLYNSRQFRKALDLARRIREESGTLSRAVIDVEAVILEYVGDVRAAVLRLRELCSGEDSAPYDRIRLAQTLFRCGERDEALETVLEINASELGHDSQSLMKLAVMKCLLGATNYMQDAYQSRRHGLNDPNAHLGYFGLFLTQGEEWEVPTVVTPGCSVRIRDEGEEQWWHILEEEEEELSGSREISPGSELAQRLLGRSVEDVVVLPKSLGDVSYKITDLQSKYVRAFQETCEEFQFRFPDNMSLMRVIMDDNFSQFFQSIDSRQQHVGNAEQLYNSQMLPFGSFCSIIGSSTLQLWPEYTRQQDKRLHFGFGGDQEAPEADELLRDADTIVLDLVALLTVHQLRLLDHLRARFLRIAIPQYVFDEIQHDVYQMKIGRAPSGYAGKDEKGRYTLTEMTEGAWRKWREFLRSVLELAESIERIPSYPLLSVKDPEATLDALTPAGAGAVFVGEEPIDKRPVLISDDLALSNVARSTGLGAVNTQAILEELSRSNIISDEQYSSMVEELALMNYWFVRVSANDVLRRLESNGYRTTPGIQAMLKTLCGPDCIEDKAISVGADVIATVALKPLIQQDSYLLLSSVLAAILHGRNTSQVLSKFEARITDRLAVAPLQCERILRRIDMYMSLRS